MRNYANLIAVYIRDKYPEVKIRVFANPAMKTSGWFICCEVWEPEWRQLIIETYPDCVLLAFGDVRTTIGWNTRMPPRRGVSFSTIRRNSLRLDWASPTLFDIIDEKLRELSSSVDVGHW